MYTFIKIKVIFKMALNVSCNSHSDIKILKGYRCRERGWGGRTKVVVRRIKDCVLVA